MIKKKSNLQQIPQAKLTTQQNVNKKIPLNQALSPSRKVSVINSKVKAVNKSPSSSQYLKSQHLPQTVETVMSRNKNKPKSSNNLDFQPAQKPIKKATSPVSSAESIKKFSKTSKVPTLKSSAINSALQSEIQQEKIKNIRQKEDNLSQKTISTLKSQIDTLKTENQELKKQNEKFNKRIEKFKSLNDENKKMLKQKIQNFNFQGKLKQQIAELTKTVQKLQSEIIKLEQQNKSIKINTQKVISSKEQKQSQTYIIQTQKENQKIEIKNQNDKQLSEKNYHSSSSRKSYGGILPLDTVYNLNDSIKMNFRTAQSTPKKDIHGKEKLLNKYDNYWSVKLGKFEEIQNLNQLSYQQNLQVKSQCPNMKKQQEQNYILPLENLLTKDIKIPQQLKQYSPSILIQKYQKISQQQQLIDSLYNIIEELSKEIENVEINKRQLQSLNHDLQIKINNLTQQNHELKTKMQQVMGTSLEINIQNIKTENKMMQVHNILLNDQTLLLDETRQLKKKTKDNLTKRDDETKKQKAYAKSAFQIQYANNFCFVDEISQFFNSQIVCHCSINSHHQFTNFQNMILTEQRNLAQQNQPRRINQKMKQNIDKSILRIDDSLEALQYFSTHTPQNLSSEVSFISDNFDCYQSQQTQKINSKKAREQQNITQANFQYENSIQDSTTNPNSLSIS